MDNRNGSKPWHATVYCPQVDLAEVNSALGIARFQDTLAGISLLVTGTYP